MTRRPGYDAMRLYRLLSERGGYVSVSEAREAGISLCFAMRSLRNRGIAEYTDRDERQNARAIALLTVLPAQAQAIREMAVDA